MKMSAILKYRWISIVMVFCLYVHYENSYILYTALMIALLPGLNKTYGVTISGHNSLFIRCYIAWGMIRIAKYSIDKREMRSVRCIGQNEKFSISPITMVQEQLSPSPPIYFYELIFTHQNINYDIVAGSKCSLRELSE